MKLLILFSLQLASPPLIALSLLVVILRHIHSLGYIDIFNPDTSKTVSEEYKDGVWKIIKKRVRWNVESCRL